MKLFCALLSIFIQVGSIVSLSTVIRDGQFLLDTTIEGDRYLRVKATVETIGYVGFGISPNNSRIGTDLMIAGYDAVTEKGYIVDYYGREDPEPIKDAEQNLVLISASENETHTTVEFLRLLDTGDEEHDVVVENRTPYIRWSWGVDDGLAYHGPDTRGTVELNLFD